MRELTVDGVRVAYADEGTGEAIVLLHGWPQNHHAWRHQIPALAKTHRVIAIDWPGFGASEKPPSARYDDDVARLGKLLDALEVKQCNLFAHDHGAFIALGFVVAHPERVMRLAILNSRAHQTFQRLSWWTTWWTSALARRTPSLLTAAPLGTINRRGLAPYARAGCFDAAQLTDYVGWMDTPDGRKWFAKFFADYDLRPRTELLAALAKLNIPTAVVWGTADPASPIAVGRELAKALPSATLTEVQGGLHYIMEHRPDDVTASLEKLLALPAANVTDAPPVPPPAPASENAIVREAKLAGWVWVVCVGLIALGALGLFTDQIGPLPTNYARALYLNLGVGLFGFALSRFEAEFLFLPIFALGILVMGVCGLLPATKPWLHETFRMDALSTYSQFAVGGISLLVWTRYRPRG